MKALFLFSGYRDIGERSLKPATQSRESAEQEILEGYALGFKRLLIKTFQFSIEMMDSDVSAPGHKEISQVRAGINVI